MSKRSSQRGAAVVEFALLCGLLLVFLLGIFEFGFLWLESHYIANAAREGARVAAKKMDNSARCDTAKTAVIQYLGGSRLFTNSSGVVRTDIFNQSSADDFSCDPAFAISTSPAVNGVEITVTINANKIWNPILFRFIAIILPGADTAVLNASSDNLKRLRQSAVYAIEPN